MKKSLDRLPFVLRAAVAAAALLLVFASKVPAQDAAAAAPDGAKARAVLGLQIQHATFAVSDIQKESDWYIGVLGFDWGEGGKVIRVNPRMVAAHLIIPGFEIALVHFDNPAQQPNSAAPAPAAQSQTPAAPPAPRHGFEHLSLTVANLDAANTFLQTTGAQMRVSRNKQDNTLTSITLTDPEGIQVELLPR